MEKNRENIEDQVNQHEEENENDVRNTDAPSAREEIPTLLSLPLSEGSGRILRYKSRLSPRSPYSQPLIRHTESSGTSPNGAHSPKTDSRSHGNYRSDTTLMVGVGSSSGESQQEGTTEGGMPLASVTELDSQADGQHSCLETETSSMAQQELVATLDQNVDNRSEQSQTFALNVYFTVGDQDDEQSQSNASTVNEGIMQSDLPPPPSYEAACRKKLMRDPNSSSLNTMDSLQPPTYRDAVGRGRYLEDAPPNYHALFAQSIFRVMDIRNEIVGQTNDNEERSVCDHILTYIILSGIIIFILGMVLPLPFAMIIIGVTHLQSCPAQPRIPVFLTSLGVFQLLEGCGRLSMYVYSKLRTHNHRDDARYKSKDPFVYFIVVWFVVGSMWVYQNYPTCHDFVPKDIKIVRKGGFDDTSWSNNQSVRATNRARLTTMLLKNQSSSPAFKPNSPSKPLGTRSKDHSDIWQNLSTARVTASPRAADFPRTTARVPEKRQKAACCGKVVYFTTFGIVTFYYSLVGVLFLVQICGSFGRLICRCRRQNRRR